MAAWSTYVAVSSPPAGTGAVGCEIESRRGKGYVVVFKMVAVNSYLESTVLLKSINNSCKNSSTTYYTT
jgi:hypothetical protein